MYPYLIAALSTAIVAILRYSLREVLTDVAPFLPFVIAVLLSAWIGGLRPGLLATALSVTAAVYLFVPPYFSLVIVNMGEAAGAILFVWMGIFISLACESMHAGRRRIELQREQLDAEIARREHAATRFRLAADAVNGIIYEHDLRRGTVERTRGLFEVLGYRPDETPATAAWWKDQIHPDDQVAVARRFDGTAVSGTRVVTEYRVRHYDGRWLDVEDRAVLLADADGKPWKMIGCIVDVTDRKQAEHALRQSEQHLELLSNTVPALISYIGPDHCYRSCNDAYTAWFGLTRDQIVGRPMREVLGERAWAVVKPWIETALTGQAVEYEAEAPYQHGKARWIHAAYRPHRDQGGAVIGVVVMVTDFTANKQAELALARSEAMFRTLGEAAPMIISLADAAGKIEYVSPAWTVFSGRPPREFLSGSWRDAIHPDDQARILEEWQQALRTRRGYEYEFRARAADGSYRWLLSRGQPVLGSDDKAVQWVNCAVDIHARKQAEESLREADRRKDEFLATLAHELRNPLAPVRNSLAILRLASADPATQGRVLDMIERQVNHMVRLVDDLLEVSRITRGKIDLRKETVALASVVQSAVETAGPNLDAAGHQLTLSLPPEPILLHADPVRLAQVLSNLLNNAAKYTEERGQIWLTAHRDGPQLTLTVRDTGTGIPAEMLPRVFDLFTQIDRTLGRAQGGLGIGLALVRSLVQMHGGSIEAHSEGPGKGSEFVITLPLAVESNHVAWPQLHDGEVRSLARRRVLVVDDNRDAADSLAILLRFQGAEVRTAYDGAAALEVMRAYRPALVFLDLGMPGMDGYAVAAEIRHTPQYQEVTLVALTGWGQEEDRRRTQAAGFDHHLTKPADTQALQTLLARLADGEPRHVETPLPQG